MSSCYYKIADMNGAHNQELLFNSCKKSSGYKRIKNTLKKIKDLPSTIETYEDYQQAIGKIKLRLILKLRRRKLSPTVFAT